MPGDRIGSPAVTVSPRAVLEPGPVLAVGQARTVRAKSGRRRRRAGMPVTERWVAEVTMRA